MQNHIKTTICKESDAENSASLSRQFPERESDAENNAYKDRLQKLLQGESARSFALRAGISASAVLQHLSGKSLPNLDTFLATAKTGNVNLVWLATGEGDMRAHAPNVSPDGNKGSVDQGVNEAVLARSVEAVEEALALAGKTVPPGTKAKMVARVYAGLARPDSPADHAEIMRLIRSML